MAKKIQLANDGDSCIDPHYESDDTGKPENVMYRAQGALRLERPLKSNGQADAI